MFHNVDLMTDQKIIILNKKNKKYKIELTSK